MRMRFLRRFHGFAAWFWFANFFAVIAVYFWAPNTWANASILYLALVSIYANFATDTDAHVTADMAVKHQEKENP